MQERLNELGHSQRDRLAFIEQRLWFLGEIQRQDLINRFGIRSAAATRDMALYRELAPGNLGYDQRQRSYIYEERFSPLFRHSPARILSWLSVGFGEGDPVHAESGIVCDTPGQLGLPRLEILAAVSRAIHKGIPLALRYHSLGSGEAQRVIVPFALVDSGLRWHARGFDRKSGEFRDFVLTRMLDATPMLNDAIASQERAEADNQWTRIVELELIPHPDRPDPEVTTLDYAMRDGVLTLKLRAATAGYLLRRWCVDCSPDHRLTGKEYRLWLKDHLTLYGVHNAHIAPGYTPGG